MTGEEGVERLDLGGASSSGMLSIDSALVEIPFAISGLDCRPPANDKLFINYLNRQIQSCNWNTSVDVVTCVNVEG